MPEPTPPTRTIFWMTATTVVVAAILGAIGGVYLGRHFRSRSAPVSLARQPAAVKPPPAGVPPATSPPARPVQKAKSARHPVAPAPSAHGRSPAAPAVPHREARRAPQLAARAAQAREQELAAGHRPPSQPRRLVARPVGAHSPVPPAKTAHWREARLPSEPEALPLPAPESKKSLRPVGVMPPVRPLPAPRWQRQQRVARRLAASRTQRVRIGRRRRLRTARWASRPARPVPVPPPHALVVAEPARLGPMSTAPRPLTPAARSQLLARAAETVRYVEQPVMLEGRPATLATYIVWDSGTPRTFSFVRQDRRTDLAKIAGVDETTGQVRVLVPDRGALIQATVPAPTVVVYGQSLKLNPPPPELVAQANNLAGPGAPLGPPPPAMPLGPPVERVAGMREQMPELVGLVLRADPASRQIVLAGPRSKTPFQVADGIAMPRVGQIIAITTTDTPVTPRPALSVTVLQPTVAGVVTLMRPTAVELSVRTIAPDGQVEEIPVPVAGDARVFINGQPGDLRALKKGIYIRAFMTPTGEARILGAPSE